MRAPQETLPPPRAVRKNKAKSLAGTPPARAVKAVKERKAKSSILEVPAPRAVKKHIKARGATIDALRSVSIGILKKRKKRSRQSSTSRERGEAKFIQGILVTPYVKSGTTENERMKAGRYAIADSLEEDELLLYTTPMGGKVFVGNQEGVDLIDQHAKQVTALEIKADSAEVVRIMLRHRFLSNYKKRFSKSLLYRADEVYINDGNRVAHRGDVLYDASLYLENKRTDHKTFVDAYGLAAKVAAGLSKATHFTYEANAK